MELHGLESTLVYFATSLRANATVLDRLKAYHEQTEPLVAFYKERGKLTVVDNQPTLAENTKAVLAAIGVEA